MRDPKCISTQDFSQSDDILILGHIVNHWYKITAQPRNTAKVHIYGRVYTFIGFLFKFNNSFLASLIGLFCTVPYVASVVTKKNVRLLTGSFKAEFFSFVAVTR